MLALRCGFPKDSLRLTKASSHLFARTGAIQTGKVLVNAETVHVGTGTSFSGLPTNQELNYFRQSKTDYECSCLFTTVIIAYDSTPPYYIRTGSS